MARIFKLSENIGVPVAYIDIEDQTELVSETQVVVDISEIGFVPSELIFDIAKDGTIIGVELL